MVKLQLIPELCNSNFCGIFLETLVFVSKIIIYKIYTSVTHNFNSDTWKIFPWTCCGFTINYLSVMNVSDSVWLTIWLEIKCDLYFFNITKMFIFFHDFTYQIGIHDHIREYSEFSEEKRFIHTWNTYKNFLYLNLCVKNNKNSS